MILESVENHRQKNPTQIWLFKAVLHHKLPVLNMKITLVFHSQDNTTKHSEIRKSERKHKSHTYSPAKNIGCI